MAVKKNITSRHGVTARSSYSRITSVTYEREKSVDNTTVRFKVYKDAAAYQAGADPLEFFTFMFTFDEADGADCLMVQAYNAMKTQNDVSGNDFTSGTTDV